jgi:putative transposase
MHMIALIWRCLKYLTLIVCHWLIRCLEAPKTQAKTVVSYNISAPLWPTTPPNAQPNFLAQAIFKGLTEPPPIQAHKPFHRFRKKAKLPEAPTCKNAPKEKWIVKKILTLIALMPNVGCRKIAATFNLRHAEQGQSVGKTFVTKLRISSQHEIVQCKTNLRKIPWPQAPNVTWALDFTDVHIDGIANVLIGVIDHGSRRILALQESQKSAASVLTLIANLIAVFGKPKSIRTDNDGAFKSETFKIGMEKLDIKHQRSDPYCPWQNGRIERFFGTFKPFIGQITIETSAQLSQACKESMLQI